MPAAMFAGAVPLGAQVAEAVPVVPTVKVEAATAFAVARGAAPLATAMLTVMESPDLTIVPPPTVFAAEMLVVLNVAGLTEVTVKLEMDGH